jgi:hypothetical protein
MSDNGQSNDGLHSIFWILALSALDRSPEERKKFLRGFSYRERRSIESEIFLIEHKARRDLQQL